MAMKMHPHPGGLIADEIDSLGLTIETAAAGLGVATSDLTAVVEGQGPISPEMAVRLEKAFGSTADMWLRLQVAYDLAQVRQNDADIVVARLAPEAA